MLPLLVEVSSLVYYLFTKCKIHVHLFIGSLKFIYLFIDIFYYDVTGRVDSEKIISLVFPYTFNIISSKEDDVLYVQNFSLKPKLDTQSQ